MSSPAPARQLIVLGVGLAVIALCALVPVPTAPVWGTMSVVAVIAGFSVSARHAFVAPVLGAAAVPLSLAASATTLSAIVMVAGYGALSAISQRWRLLPITAAIGPLVSFATVSPPDDLSGAMVLLIAATVLVPGLIVAVTARLVLGRGGSPTPDDGPTPWYAIGCSVAVIVPLLAGLTWLMVGPLAGRYAWWAPLTFFVVLLPSAGLSLQRIRDRVTGTAAGGLLAAVATVVVPFGWLTTILCAVCLVLTIVTNLQSRYFLYSAFLTMTILFAAQETGSTLLIDALRVGATLLGALFAALAVWAIHPLVARRAVAAQPEGS